MLSPVQAPAEERLLRGNIGAIVMMLMRQSIHSSAKLKTFMHVKRISRRWCTSSAHGLLDARAFEPRAFTQ